MTGPDQDNYRYPDPGERVTIAVIDQGKISPEEWSAQESIVLDQIVAMLRRSTLARLLDYGSGTGRLAVRLAALFDSVTSFEPDASRAQTQREVVAAASLQDRIAVVEDAAETGEGYDAVLCSHVIQHVPHAVAERVLADVARRVAPGGAVVLLTTLSPDDSTRYVLNYIDESGRAVEEEVTADGFEHAFREQIVGVLPIRFFPFVGLIDTLNRSGMDTLAAFGFHGSSGVVGPVTEPTPELGRCRDVAVLARRR